MNRKLRRRELLREGLQLPLVSAGLLALSACGDSRKGDTGLVCADPEKMTSAEASVRRSLNYVENAGDPAKTCTDCDFFTMPAEGGDCGSCDIFGAPANPAGHCDSWSTDA